MARYEKGDKYVGGTTFRKPSGETYKVSGTFTSPSGKVSRISDTGRVTTVREGKRRSKKDPMEYYEQALEAQKKARGEEYKTGQRALEQSAEDAARRAYVTYMQQTRALPEQLAAAGIGGGAAETSRLGLETGYGAGLSGIEQQRLQGLAGLQSQYQRGIATDVAAAQQQMANLAIQRQREEEARQYELQRIRAQQEAQKPAKPVAQQSAQPAAEPETPRREPKGGYPKMGSYEMIQIFDDVLKSNKTQTERLNHLSKLFQDNKISAQMRDQMAYAIVNQGR